MSSKRERGLGLVVGVVVGLSIAACAENDDGFDAVADRTACQARPPGSGAIVVHYGAPHEISPPASFLDAIAGEAEQVIVTRALAPNCSDGPFAYWRSKGDRFRWAFKLTAHDAAKHLSEGTFVGFVRERIDEGWDYVAIDEINANPNAPTQWTNQSESSVRLIAALQELSGSGYGRRVMPYFAASTVSNPNRSQQISNILQAIPAHMRIGMLELYRYTSDAHTVEQHRAYFHDKARNFEMAAPGVNHHIIAILGVINKSEHNFTYLNDPPDDLASLQRQFAALHQHNSLTRRHPGVGAYSWGATRHRHPHYSQQDLFTRFRDLSDWYAVHFGVNAPGVDDAPGGDDGSGDPDLPPPLCNEPHEADVGGICVPSCGAAGGNTCLPAGHHACDDYGALAAYDCAICCARPDLLTVYRGYNPTLRTHVYGLSAHDVSIDGAQLEGPTFAIARDGAGDRTELFACLKPNGRPLYTTAGDCEGLGSLQAGMGFVAVAPVEGSRPLHRLYHSGNGAHFYAAIDAERDAALGLGYVYEGVQAYVW
jgi:hypothetical protein